MDNFQKKIQTTIEKHNEQERRNSKIRAIQTLQDNKVFLLYLPKEFAADLKITKGDYVRCWVKNKQFVVEKVDF